MKSAAFAVLTLRARVPCRQPLGWREWTARDTKTLVKLYPSVQAGMDLTSLIGACLASSGCREDSQD